jgi:hypothetical protein
MFFEIINDAKTGMQVTVVPETLTIQVFRDLFDRDKSKTKDNAFKDFTYIYHTCDYNSPYSNYPEAERKSKVISEVVSKGYKPDKKVEEACVSYKELIETPITKMYQVTKDKVNEIIDFVNTTIVNEDNLTVFQKMVIDFTKFASSYKELEKLVRSEKDAASAKIRGDKQAYTRYSE